MAVPIRQRGGLPVQVGKDGGLKNAVVAVTGMTDEKFLTEFTGQDIQAELCEFKPYVTAVVENQKSFRVVNTDEESVQVEVKKEGDQIILKDLEMDPKDKKFKETKVKESDTINTSAGPVRGARQPHERDRRERIPSRVADDRANCEAAGRPVRLGSLGDGAPAALPGREAGDDP